MAIVMIELDTACVTGDELVRYLKGGQVLEATAYLNNRWEDYSAAALVKEWGCRNVKMEFLQDDTAGTLILTVNYAELAPEMLESRFRKQNGVANYEICNALFLRHFV